MKLLTRGYFGWGSSNARYANPQSGLVIHYDGPGNRLTERPHSKCVEYWKGVRQFHMNDRHWADIGYSFGVCPHAFDHNNGYVFEGRGLRREQAAQQGGNTAWYSVTLMLGENEAPTAIQIQTVRELRKWLHNQTGMAEVIKGHRDITETTCPGTLLYKMVRNGTFSKDAPPKVIGNGWPYGPDAYMHETWKDSWGVRKVQEKLNQLGYKPNLVVDGDYGPLTQKAVVWFQKKKGLKADGFVGPITWNALFK